MRNVVLTVDNRTGRIVSSVTIENLDEPGKSLRCDTLVNTSVLYMILPSAWRDRLGDLEEIETLELQTATQETTKGFICGHVRIQIEGFRSIHNEVCFVDMKPDEGTYELLIGYIVLERSRAVVDMLGPD